MKRATMLALMVLGAISLFTTAPAFAADYNGNCAGAANWSQTDGQGNVTITDTSCVISGPVTASGHIWISATTIQAQALTANGGPITLTGNGGTTTGALSATAGNVWVDDSGGSVTLGSVNTASGGSGGEIQIYSGNGSVTTGALTTTSSPGQATTGLIQVWATTTITVNGAVQSGYSVEIIAPSSSGGGVTTGTTANTITTTGAVSSAAQPIAINAAGQISIGGNVSSNGGAIAIHANVSASASTSTATFSTSAATGANGVAGTINASGSGSSNGIYLTNGGTGGITLKNAGDLSSSGGGVVVDACNENDVSTCTAPIVIGAGTLSTDGGSNPAGIQLFIGGTITTQGGTTLSASDSVTGSGVKIHYVTLSATTITLSGNLTINVNGDNPVGGPSGGGSIELNNLGANSASDGFATFGAVTVTTTAAPTSALTITGSGTLTGTSQGKNQLVGMQGGGSALTYSAGTLTFNTNDSSSTIEVLSASGTATNFSGSAPANLNAIGPSSGNGGGGTINFYPGSMGTITPKLTLKANGAGTGLGGNINLIAGSGNVSLGSNAGSLSLSATGGSTVSGGNVTGGAISVSTPGNVTLDSSSVAPNVTAAAGSNNGGGSISINAAALTYPSGITLTATGDGSGAGGNITLSTTSTINIASTPLHFNASGGSSSQTGGVVTIVNASNFDVNTYMNVVGGSSVSSTSFDGQVNLNGVNCQQWFVNSSQWPKTYWDCAHTGTQSSPGTPPATDSAVASLAQTSTLNPLRTTMANAPVQLYVFATEPPF